MKNEPKKIVLAYSGGLDTSVMLHWLKHHYGADVIAATVDVGQGEELDGLEEKALRTGASRFYVLDRVDEFVRDFVFPAVKANAQYEGYYLMGTALARPCIFRAIVDVAEKEDADAVAHGATGKGNDQVRFELTAYALKPDIRCIAPWRTWPFKGREELIAYAREHDIPITSTEEKPYSIDRNLMHVSYEGGILEDPWQAPPEDMFLVTRSPLDAPNEPEEVRIEFKDGVPVAVDGERLGPRKLLEQLNALGARHGVGRVDIVENRYVGIKSRGVYETPGVTILQHAHRAVESLTLDREVLRLRDSLVPKFSELVYNGYWFSPEMEHLLGFMDAIQRGVTGTARIRLYKGSATIVGRQAPNSLYNPEVATFNADHTYNHADAEGFIRINALRLRLYHYMKTRAFEDPRRQKLIDVREFLDGYIE